MVDKRDQMSLTAQIFEHLHEAVLVTNMDRTIQQINPMFTSITGYGPEVIGQDAKMLASGKDSEEFYQTVSTTLAKEGFWLGELRNRRKNGEEYIQATAIFTIKDKQGRVVAYASVFSDVTEKKMAEEQTTYELSIAREVQKSVFSRNIVSESIDIAGQYTPSHELGGDMYVWYKIDEHRYGIFVSDIMGKGVAASLVAMSIRSLLKGLMTRVIEPTQVIKELNKHTTTLFAEHNAIIPYYFTCFYTVIDLFNRKIEYVSCGHPPALLIRSDGTTVTLDSTNVPVGMLEHIQPMKETIDYEPLSTLVICTDGIYDLLDRRLGNSVEKLSQLVSEMKQHPAEETVQDIMSTIVAKVPSWEDDLAIVVAKLKS